MESILEQLEANLITTQGSKRKRVYIVHRERKKKRNRVR